MADRILTWYLETLTGDGTNQGPSYVLDQSYTPNSVRVHAKRAPGYDSLRVDIKADGISIFPAAIRAGVAGVPSVQKGSQLEDHWDSFADAPTLAEFTVVTLDVLDSGGASGITVTLELDT